MPMESCGMLLVTGHAVRGEPSSSFWGDSSQDGRHRKTWMGSVEDDTDFSRHRLAPETKHWVDTMQLMESAVS